MDKRVELPPIASSRPYLNLLVVDDNVDGADSLAMLLRLKHHEVEVAYRVSTAFQIAVVGQPNVILVDGGSNGVDGYQLARRLRELPQMRNSVLIAMTRFEQEDDFARAREAGFDHQIVKPVEAAQFQNLLFLLAQLEINMIPNLTSPPHLIESAQECLRNHSYGPGLKNVTCDHKDGTLILRGDVETYYIKQVAKEAVAKLEGVEHIDNQLQVKSNMRRR